MLKSIKTVADALKQSTSFRIAYALAPFHGSDRQVGWSALEADRAAGRRVTYITTRSDHDMIASYFPDSQRERASLQFGTVRVVPWPFNLSPRLVPFGYLRYLVWVILIQLYAAVTLRNTTPRTFHFLTYTQLSTPILLPRSIPSSHGPAGTIPRIPLRSGVNSLLTVKSQLMWRLIMPVVSFLKRKRQVKSAVVHPSLATKAAGCTDAAVLSALNVDYLSDTEIPDAYKMFDAIAVGRNIPIKNMRLTIAAFRIIAAQQTKRFIIIDSTLPTDFQEQKHGILTLGRQPRSTVESYLRRSMLHVMLSLEMGGYINLEAAVCEVPTLCLDGFGASYMLGPSASFTLPLSALHPDEISERITILLSNAPKLQAEGLRQAGNARRFIVTNRKKFADWLAETA